MQRRQVRLRREYLYRKAQEAKSQAIHDRKQQLKLALQDGKPIPYELRDDAEVLRKELHYDEAHLVASSGPPTHIDDEYARAGTQDPKLLITTSRDPSSRLQQFAKEMRLVYPNAQRINRGNYVMGDIVEACRANDVTDLIILHEHRGQPDGMIVSHFPYGPTACFTLHNVKLRHDLPSADMGTVSEQYPHLIFNKFSSKLGSRVQNVLKYMFPVPKETSQRVMTFANEGDFISFRHHVFTKVGKDVQLVEVGPRFEMRAYEIRLGTVELPDADVEWALRPYHNTAKKRDLL
ncbi:hypothetical protein SeMB42_g04209 [Synchytrium endobioticum]|uniref:U3 small nucleolar ribonucleoprotein protein IMP4 n=1 Tax=Synchytrium endobioticum TaxID=286115 RepID=A0A507D1H8_9FUNG|nr:hypothetical protein SeMB42_g04209 [Synchytrium endobioticum]TPX45313.1 hypothetical protein SeLEV6574_g03919 [Synchytrium endobioticum]